VATRRARCVHERPRTAERCRKVGREPHDAGLCGVEAGSDSVWAVTCFVTRAGFLRGGVSRALARAAVDFARERGARALEGYPMLTEPGKEITWGELHVGSRSIFAAAGFAEVSRPSPRRVVMRIDF
jgi:GNAT superfamily N-acetyltransferase